MHTVWRGLLRRAQEQGAVRGDLTFEDMFVLLWSLSRIIDATYGVAPHVWRRHLYLMLDAYRAEKAHLLPEPPLTTEQMARATQRLSFTQSTPGESGEVPAGGIACLLGTFPPTANTSLSL